MIAAVVGLALPSVILWWALRSFVGGAGPRELDGTRDAPQPSRPAAAALALGFAMVGATGVTSWTWFLWLHLAGTPGAPYLAVELAVVVGIAWALRASGSPDAPAPRAAGGGAALAGLGVRRLAAGLAAALGLVWTLSFCSISWLHPHGSWDAVSIWNLHARVLAGGAAAWHAFMRDAAACAFHGDYPLHVPITVARLWTLAGNTTPAAGALVSLWFAVAVVLLCGGLVGVLRGSTQALLATATLLGTSAFVAQSSNQYADLPLAACMLAAAAALARGDERGAANSRWLLLAGAATALAAWTKNEGLLFAGAVLAVAGTRAWRAGRGARLRRVAPLLAGLAPGLLVLGYFKLALAPPNDLLAGQGVVATLTRIATPRRYAVIGAELVRNALRMAKALVLVLPAYGWLMGRTGARQVGRPARTILALYGFMLLGDVAVYVITPQPLGWHLNTSARRLLLQLWPGMVAAFFVLVAAPEERLRAAQPMPGDPASAGHDPHGDPAGGGGGSAVAAPSASSLAYFRRT